MAAIPYLYKRLRSMDVPHAVAVLLADPDEDQLTLGTKKVVCVPTGTGGFEDQPDGTLWVEYTA